MRATQEKKVSALELSVAEAVLSSKEVYTLHAALLVSPSETSVPEGVKCRDPPPLEYPPLRVLLPSVLASPEAPPVPPSSDSPSPASTCAPITHTCSRRSLAHLSLAPLQFHGKYRCHTPASLICRVMLLY